MMDVLNLVVAGFALWLSQKRSTARHTYGYRRASILSALLNSSLLLGTATYIMIEAFGRMLHPVDTVGSTMMAVAGVGILVNGLSGWWLMRSNRQDINIRSASLHLLGDALVSFGVVVGGGIIVLT